MTPNEYLKQVQTLRKALSRVARRYVTVSDDVQDAVQQATLRGYEKLHEYTEAKGPLEQWLRGFVILEAKRISRENYRELDDIRAAEEQDFEDFDDEGRPVEPPSDVWRAKKKDTHEPVEDGYMIDYELRHDLTAALSSLDETARAVFLDVHMYEYTIEETAKRRNLSLGNVRGLVSRARLELQMRLRDYQGTQVEDTDELELAV